jgi:6-phosphogluconolactonase (cycloisomerase 2 family)
VADSPTNAGSGYWTAIDPKGKFLYLSEGSDGIADGVFGTIQEFTLDAHGLPTPVSYVQSAASQGALAIDPQSRFLYVSYAGLSGTGISVYTIDSTSGNLTPVAGSPFDTGPCSPEKILPDPTGRFVYANQSGSGCLSSQLTAFSVDPVTGFLTPIAGSPFPPVVGVVGWPVMDKTGKFIYMVGDHATQISVLAIDPNSGALSLQSGLAFILSNDVWGGMLDPSGQFLYFFESNGLGGGNIAGCKIDATTGALTPLPGISFAANTAPQSAVILKTH